MAQTDRAHRRHNTTHALCMFDNQSERHIQIIK